MSVAHLRKNYNQGELLKADLAEDPFQQFKIWLEQAIDARLPEPNAMTLATITPDGKPSARMVLLKELDDRGFVFYTNYTSQKAKHLNKNPYASLVFWWAQLERQVRIEGTVEKVTGDESDAYFASRPLASQLGAWASPQSQVIADREVLEQKYKDVEAQYFDQIIPRPPHWGGFRVLPYSLEFWQGRPSRLHDRLRYSLIEGEGWHLDRLAP